VSWVPRDRRWRAQFLQNGKRTHLGSFDTEEGAARAHDRMAVWCHLHGLERPLAGGEGGGAYASVSFTEDLNFDYGEYAGELDMLRGITQDELVQQLRRSEGSRGPASSKFRGVRRAPRGGRWEARFMHNSKRTSLGFFGTEKHAAHAFDRMLVWCEMNGVQRNPRGSKLNFRRVDYEGEEDTLRGRTWDKMVAKLRREGLAQALALRVTAFNAEGDEAGEGAGGGSGGIELGGAEGGAASTRQAVRTRQPLASTAAATRPGGY
jgi:hypothetical protein